MSSSAILLDDPGWVIALKGLLIFVLCVLLTLMSVWGERRIVAHADAPWSKPSWAFWINPSSR